MLTPILPLLTVLRAIAFTGVDEYALQRSIGAALAVSQMEFEPEARLSSTDRIDFLVGDVGIEVKVDGSPSAVLRQCFRYLAHARVRALVVVSAKASLVRSLPPRVEIKGVGKSIYCIETWRHCL